MKSPNLESKKYYYYWWSDICSIAFPSMKFKIILDNKPIYALGCSTNYYLEEIKWPDKRIVGISDIDPLEVNKQNKEISDVNNLFTEFGLNDK